MRSIIALTVALLTLSLSSMASAEEPDQNSPRRAARSHVDVVIALDTSNSMDGLIDAARQKLWDIVNELATAKPTPILRVGLVSFGNDGYQEDGWTRIDVPLTDDLDTVYDHLMTLRTNGGTEYVGRAIHVSRTKLLWDGDPKALKMIFVAGNEGADQDRSYNSVAEAAAAIREGIIVNTIFCGAKRDRVARGWSDVAARADGRFAAIDQNRATVAIATPYDDKLAALNSKLNRTYVAYGAGGGRAMVRQARADKKARGMSKAASASRAKAKATKLYRNSAWDLVDLDEEGGLGGVAAADLPTEMKGMSAPKRKVYIAKKRAEREKIKEDIRAESKKRDAFLAKAKKKSGKTAKAEFDSAVMDALHEQAATKGITF